MNVFPRLVFVVIASVLWFGLPAGFRLQAQEDVKISKDQLEELKRKAAEADQLQKQLQQARQEIQTLKGGGGTNSVIVPAVRDSKNKVVPIPAAVFQSIPAQPATPPLPQVPPVTENTVLSVNDLLTYFSQDPAAASARFLHKTFAIRGHITDFRKPMFVSTYDVNFRLPGQNAYVSCLFRPRDELKTFFVSENGEEMIGIDSRSRKVLARVGTEITVRGYCGGLKDGVLQMGGCQYIVSPKASR
jgi:type II secretory pathway pseudopilin PulG